MQRRGVNFFEPGTVPSVHVLSFSARATVGRLYTSADGVNDCHFCVGDVSFLSPWPESAALQHQDLQDEGCE